MSAYPKLKPRLKTYIVPTIVHGSFGCELEVEASSEEEARALVLKGEGQMPDGEGYDWNRWEETRQEIGDWQPIREDRP